MNQSVYLGLIQNIAILLAFSMLHEYIWLKDIDKQSLKKQIAVGIVTGLVAIVLMLTPWTLAPGLVFDTRSILLSISGLFFGTIPTVIAIIISAIFRFQLGGPGVYMGIAVIVTSGLIGIGWRFNSPLQKQNIKWLELLKMGVLVHLVMLACTMLLPKSIWFQTLEKMALPVMLIYSIGTVLLGTLMFDQLKNWKNREAQKKLIESENRFSEVLLKINLISVIFDKEAKVTFCNPYLLNLTGYSSNEVVGKDWVDTFIDDNYKKIVTEVLQQILFGEKKESYFENPIVGKDGQQHIIAWNNIPLISDGQIIGMASIGEDLTEKKQAEEQRLRVTNILEASLNEIYLINSQTFKFEYMNFGALTNLGISKEKALLLTPMDLNPSLSVDDFKTIVQPVLAGEAPLVVYETLHQRHDGTRYNVEVYLQLFDNPKHKVFLAIAQDITQRKLSEALLMAAKEKAEESDRLKSIFLANMSHEIRTPMNAIVGFSSLLSDIDLPSDKKIQYVDIIKQSSNRLLHVINDILDTSKLEARQMQLFDNDFNPASVVQQSISILQNSDLFNAKSNVELIVKIDPLAQKIVVNGDLNRFQQVLDNLLTNAYKYTSAGFVEISLTITPSQNGMVTSVTVSDSGIGIPIDKQKLIFQRFRQIEEEEFHEGTGLGLSIAKGLVELMGGTIGFESELGRGSAFYFSIPFKLPSEGNLNLPVTSIDFPFNTKIQMVVAEDDYASSIYLKELIADLNWEVEWVENGNDFIELIARIEPDLVLLDINMPGKNGFECLHAIQKKNNSKIKVLAQTAFCSPDDKKRYNEAGFHGLLAKPFGKNDLLNEIKRVIVDSTN